MLDEFEKTAWAGLEPDGYSLTTVLHREHGGGVRVHVLTARCDMETGKSLNVSPPDWQKTFEPLRDALNHEHGWSRLCVQANLPAWHGGEQERVVAEGTPHHFARPWSAFVAHGLPAAVLRIRAPKPVASETRSGASS